ncbi:hypothetical protein Moror_9191 [Moniliophthora roreri MCA 2997]|uniref:Uncharacterized protein n=2 Tax=Moniliophthora roreri TaxID=221103 RepID=V2WDT3_MONRO|nr:hypothetical protein Moror_9191 [Moniliophthora roreri MCA 2997]
MPALPANAPAEAVLTSTISSLPTPFLSLLGLFSLFYLFGPSIFQWRFPCRTTDQLDQFIDDLEDLIEANSSLENDVLGPCTDRFKASLQNLNDVADEIKTRTYRQHYHSANPLARWRMLRDVDRCYRSLKRLEKQIEVKIHGQS